MGYLVTGRDGLVVWPDGRILGTSPPSPPSSPSSGNHLQKVISTILIFGPELVSYERSRRENRANLHEISARVFFCKNIKKSRSNDIYNIDIFLDTDSENGFFNQMFQSPDPAARPPACPAALPTALPTATS